MNRFVLSLATPTLCPRHARFARAGERQEGPGEDHLRRVRRDVARGSGAHHGLSRRQVEGRQEGRRHRRRRRAAPARRVGRLLQRWPRSRWARSRWWRSWPRSASPAPGATWPPRPRPCASWPAWGSVWLLDAVGRAPDPRRGGLRHRRPRARALRSCAPARTPACSASRAARPPSATSCAWPRPRAGGRAAVLRHGRPAINPWLQTTLAWELDVPLSGVQATWASSKAPPPLGAAGARVPRAGAARRPASSAAGGRDRRHRRNPIGTLAGAARRGVSAGTGATVTVDAARRGPPQRRAARGRRTGPIVVLSFPYDAHIVGASCAASRSGASTGTRASGGRRSTTGAACTSRRCSTASRS